MPNTILSRASDPHQKASCTTGSSRSRAFTQIAETNRQTPWEKPACDRRVGRSDLKIRIFVQGQGGSEFSAAGILPYFEDWKRGPDTEIGRKDNFEMASSDFWSHLVLCKGYGTESDYVWISVMNRLDVCIASFISRINSSISPCREENSERKDPMACALRLCFKNKTLS
jgi:hypothetical protein